MNGDTGGNPFTILLERIKHKKNTSVGIFNTRELISKLKKINAASNIINLLHIVVAKYHRFFFIHQGY